MHDTPDSQNSPARTELHGSPGSPPHRMAAIAIVALVAGAVFAVMCSDVYRIYSGGILSGVSIELNDVELRVEWHEGAGTSVSFSGPCPEAWGLRVGYMLHYRGANGHRWGRGRYWVDTMNDTAFFRHDQ